MSKIRIYVSLLLCKSEAEPKTSVRYPLSALGFSWICFDFFIKQCVKVLFECTYVSMFCVT